jgi:homoserine dehydrogenase
MELKLAFIGFGNVARAFARMLCAHRSRLAEDYDLTWKVTALATGKHGCVLSQSALDVEEAVAVVERNESLTELSTVRAAHGSIEII